MTNLHRAHLISVVCALRAALLLLLGTTHAAETLNLGVTEVVTAMTKRAVYSVSPVIRTAIGGTHLSIIGKGFATNLFDVTVVQIGDVYGFVTCDVFEGTCTVDCGR